MCYSHQKSTRLLLAGTVHVSSRDLFCKWGRPSLRKARVVTRFKMATGDLREIHIAMQLHMLHDVTYTFCKQAAETPTWGS